jgi:hypothetical protein
MKDGEPRYKHVDIVVAACRMKDLSAHNSPFFHLYLSRRKDNTEHRDYIGKIRAALGRDAIGLRPGDVGTEIQQARPKLFS